ncbi:hypothetical protein BGZ90_008398, partial [Linnemannia elongata]
NYKEVQEKALEAFYKKELPVWIEAHTKHLKDNGSNGHYVGNKVASDEILDKIKQGSPEIWKVKETVDSEPRLQTWRQSEAYKKHISFSQVMYAKAGI